MTEVTCSCGGPIRDNAHLCRDCTSRLLRDLGDVPALATEITTTATRQSRTGSGNGGRRSSTTPLPFDDHVTTQATELQADLVGWVRIVMDDQAAARLPKDSTLTVLSIWLLAWVPWIRQQQIAGDVHRAVTHRVARLRASIDTRPERIYAGPCAAPLSNLASEVDMTCPEDLYASRGSAWVTCQGCGARHDVQGRQDWLLTVAENQLETVGTLAQAVTSLGRPVSRDSIKGYVARGRLVAHGLDTAGRSLYRVGDLLDVLAEVAASKARAAEKQTTRRTA